MMDVWTCFNQYANCRMLNLFLLGDFLVFPFQTTFWLPCMVLSIPASTPCSVILFIPHIHQLANCPIVDSQPNAALSCTWFVSKYLVWWSVEGVNHCLVRFGLFYVMLIAFQLSFAVVRFQTKEKSIANLEGQLPEEWKLCERKP